MDTRHPASKKSVCVLGDSGKGPALVILHGEETNASKVVPFLAGEFRVISLAGGTTDAIAAQLLGLGVQEAAIVARATTAMVALDLALKYSSLVRSVALLAPSPLPGDLAAGLSGLKTPVQALFGTADAGRARDAARNFCKALPHCNLMYVFDAGVVPDADRPEAVAAALREFARKREKFLVTDKSAKIYP